MIYYICFSCTNTVYFLCKCSQTFCAHTSYYLWPLADVSLKLSKQSMFPSTYPTMRRKPSILFCCSSSPPPSCNPDAVTLHHLLLANSSSTSLFSTCSDLHVGHRLTCRQCSLRNRPPCHSIYSYSLVSQNWNDEKKTLHYLVVHLWIQHKQLFFCVIKSYNEHILYAQNLYT